MIRRFREPANGTTHLIGAILALVALGFLLVLAVRTDSPRALIACAIFGVSLVALYVASTVHHTLPLGPIGIARTLRLDHMMIFVLIAGTYTPFCLLALHGAWRWGLLAAVWALAAGGIALKVGWMDAPTWLSTGIYIGMGWLAIIAAPAFLATVPRAGLVWVVAGGLVYTIGALIYATGWPRLRPGIFDAHALWHLLVIGGSACHVWAVARYIVPLA